MLFPAFLRHPANIDAFKTAHQFVQLLESPEFAAQVLRNADADSAAHCICPRTTIVYRQNGHCQCIENHIKRDVDPVSKLSATPFKTSVRSPASSGIAPNSSGTASKSSDMTSRLSGIASKPSGVASSLTISDHDNTNLDVIAEKTTVAKTTLKLNARPTTAKLSTLETNAANNPAQIAPFTGGTSVLPTRVHPVLVCFSGACFASNELSSLNIFKRDSGSLLSDAEAASICTNMIYVVCLQGQCLCHAPKRSIPDENVPESIVNNCPKDHVLICNSKSCSCDKIFKQALKPQIPNLGPCFFGNPVCLAGPACYCPATNEAPTGKVPFPSRSIKAGSPKDGALVCSRDKPFICFNKECFCYVGPLTKVQPDPSRDSGASSRPSPINITIGSSDGARLHRFAPRSKDNRQTLTATQNIPPRSLDARFIVPALSADDPSPRKTLKDSEEPLPPIALPIVSLDSNHKPVILPLGPEPNQLV